MNMELLPFKNGKPNSESASTLDRGLIPSWIVSCANSHLPNNQKNQLEHILFIPTYSVVYLAKIPSKNSDRGSHDSIPYVKLVTFT